MEEVKRNSLQAWILAARPKTLTGAITPVMIGTALAAMDGGSLVAHQRDLVDELILSALEV